MATASVIHGNEEERRTCRSCHSPSLLVDWSAGDVVCTNCGVIQKEHILDDRPEWRDFQEDADLVKNGGLSQKARCGMVPVNEARHVGGLEPTRLSKHVFGGTTTTSSHQHSSYRRRLVKTNRQIDVLMVKQHAKALKQAKLSRQAVYKRKQLSLHGDTESATDYTDLEANTNHVGPDHDLQLDFQEQDAIQTQTALLAEKWSLERAVLLHGTPQELSQQASPSCHSMEEERQELLQQLNQNLKRASADLYCAYTMLQNACRELHLPHRVSHEATNMLCRYASKRNGLFVKGVSSRISCKTSQQELSKEALDHLREWNKQKQMASLGCALLFLTSRNLGWTRSLAEVCSGFRRGGKDPTNQVVKTKHACKAIAEIKQTFPDYARSLVTNLYSHMIDNNSASPLQDTDRFVQHVTRKLDLPPVALACIRLLVRRKCQQTTTTQLLSSGTKMSIVCASYTCFVCMAGATMQRLARQAQVSQRQRQERTSIHKKRKATSNLVRRVQKKKLFRMDNAATDNKERHVDNGKHNVKLKEASQSIAPNKDENFSQATLRDTSVATIKTETTDTTASFDVFSHDGIPHDSTAEVEYEMRRMWDAWMEQMSWVRSMSLIEQSCGVSRSAVLDYYKTEIDPHRGKLLQTLQDETTDTAETENAESIRDTPLALVLLSHITAAAPLMTSKYKEGM